MLSFNEPYSLNIRFEKSFEYKNKAKRGFSQLARAARPSETPVVQ